MTLEKKRKSINVLVTASGAMGTYGLIDCLRKNFDKKKLKIICTDINCQPVIRQFADNFYQLPKGNSKKFLSSLIDICKNEKIDIVLPGSSLEVFAISKNYDFIKSKNILSPITKYSILKKMKYKHQVYKKLEKIVPIPKYFVVKNEKEFLKAISKLGFPKNKICFKPSNYLFTDGMRGFRIISKKTNLVNSVLKNKPNSPEIDLETATRFFQKNKTKFLIMEYLPGDHHSVYGLSTKGKLYDCVSLHYQQTKEGNGIIITPEKNEELEEYTKLILKEYPLNGNFDVEFRIGSDGKPKLIEINPRTASAMCSTLPGGLNFPYLSIKMALDEKINKKKFRYNYTLMKYWSQISVKN